MSVKVKWRSVLDSSGAQFNCNNSWDVADVVVVRRQLGLNSEGELSAN